MFVINGRTGCQTVSIQISRFGLAVGARKMIDAEYDHAADSISSGTYVKPTLKKITYNNENKRSECFRLGKHSKCFCGHVLPSHNDAYYGKKFNTACRECPCKTFRFVPSRP